MSLLVDNPVLRREVRARIRLRGIRGAARITITAIIVLIIVRYYAIGVGQVMRGSISDASDLAIGISYFLLVLIALIGPSIAATAITHEREQQTWEGLIVTRLSSAQVILGKWLARQTITGILLLIALPLLIASDVKAGGGIVGVLTVLLFLSLNSAFFAAVGLFTSFSARRTSAAVAIALLISAAVCIGTVIVDGIIAAFRDYGSGQVVMRFNPFYAMSALVDRTAITFRYDRLGPDPSICIIFELIVLCATLLSMIARLDRSSGA